jgi:hypothetical protein
MHSYIYIYVYYQSILTPLADFGTSPRLGRAGITQALVACPLESCIDGGLLPCFKTYTVDLYFFNPKTQTKLVKMGYKTLISSDQMCIFLGVTEYENKNNCRFAIWKFTDIPSMASGESTIWFDEFPAN